MKVKIKCDAGESWLSDATIEGTADGPDELAYILREICRATHHDEVDVLPQMVWFSPITWQQFFAAMPNGLESALEALQAEIESRKASPSEK